MISDHSEYSQSSPSEEDEQPVNQGCNKIRRSRKKRKFQLLDGGVFVSCGTQPDERITINLALTHYEVIAQVAEELGWKLQRRMHRKKAWDVLWTDNHILPDLLMRMKPFQKISHYPGIHVLARKNLLAMSLMEMQKYAPEEYNFFPKTWLLPTQFPELRRYLEWEENKDKVLIVKPEAECQGRGIFLTQGLEGLVKGRHYVIQEYMDRPLLIEGLKFDCRVYVLLCGVAPMRLYVYEEGLARLSTQKYETPTNKNMKQQFMHLTNYAINKQNARFVYNSSSQNMNIGHKRSLSSVMKIIGEKGFNIEEVRNSIDAVIAKTLFVGHPLACHQYRFCQPEDPYRNMCFHILGIDIMLDEQCKPWVIEVNHTPSFATDTPLDHHIKYNLIKDTLILLNVTHQSRNEALQRYKTAKLEAKLKKVQKRQLYQNAERQAQVQEAQQRRDNYQKVHLGGYRRVLPTSDAFRSNLYEQLIATAQKTYFAENNVLRTQMEKQKATDVGSANTPAPLKRNSINSSDSPEIPTLKNLVNSNTCKNKNMPRQSAAGNGSRSRQRPSQISKAHSSAKGKVEGSMRLHERGGEKESAKREREERKDRQKQKSYSIGLGVRKRQINKGKNIGKTESGSGEESSEQI